jgi:ribonuclease-3
MSGPAHAPEFTVVVSVEGEKPEIAKASSKRQAEQLAAKALFERLEKI